LKKVDLILKNCQIVKPQGTFGGDIIIQDGKIVAITHQRFIEADNLIDVNYNYVLPGLIDTHVHLGRYTQSFGEDCRSESKSALTGGVTTMLVYLSFRDSYAKYLSSMIQQVEKNSEIDVGFHIIISAENQIKEIPKYARDFGITSFKFLMAYKGGENLGSFQGVDDGFLFDGFQEIGKVKDCLAIVHAENSELIARFCQKIKQSGRQDAAAWSESRPPICEEESIGRALIFAERSGCPLVIAHLSSGRGLKILEKKVNEEDQVYVETCPHYLSLTKNFSQSIGSLGKVNPPLRDQGDINTLWEGIRVGLVDFIGSDHCPYTLKLKGKDLWSARAGLTGIAMSLPIMLSEGYHKRDLPLEKIVEICSYNPAKCFNLFPKKGVIEVGSDADLVVIDLNKEVRISTSLLNSISDYSPYEGYVCKGWPVMTIVGGEIVYQNGKLIDRKKKGRYLRRKLI